MGKHVIFLGAGASKSSGYPLGDDLRKDHMASTDGLKGLISKAIEKKEISGAALVDILDAFETWANPFHQSLQLFRQGCFGTIDEYCKLIRGTKPGEVVKMKKVLRVALGLHNPEERFTKSDYYPFVQRLFAKDIKSLRDDVAVISFNYDVYLEWLLGRACRTRLSALSHNLDVLPSTIRGAVTSGFSGGEGGRKEIREGDGFCLLKLHGMIAWPGTIMDHAGEQIGTDYGFEAMFEPSIIPRLKGILSGRVHKGVPPIVFPWEIMTENGDFAPNDNFVLTDKPLNGWRDGGRTEEEPEIHSIFRDIWFRARKEVQAATKISFVGISFHEYLNLGLGYLFKGRTNPVELVVTDRESVTSSGQFKHMGTLTPTSPTARLLTLLKENCNEMVCNQYASVDLGRGQFMAANGKASSAKIRTNFADFIATEMD